MSIYEMFYPGVYSPEDQSVIDSYMARLAKIRELGDNIDVDALVNGKIDPEVDSRVRADFMGQPIAYGGHQSEIDIRNYDPDNPLYSDDAYAKKMGYDGKLCLPALEAGGAWREMPAELRDNLVVSCMNCKVEFISPVYPGETLYPINIDAASRDITLESGSEYRTFALEGASRVYNQLGELKQIVTGRVKESLRRHVDPALRNKTPMPNWECPEWWNLRPRHVYTAEDWDTIKAIWGKESRRGDAPLYWEDVEVGSAPLCLLEGPVSQLDQIKYHGHMEAGSPSLKKVMADPVMGSSLPVDAFGEYYEPNGVGHLEDGRIPNHRPCFFNFMPVNFVIQALNNWIGDAAAAQVKSIEWRIMYDLPGYEDMIPVTDYGTKYVSAVPGMESRHVTSHGMTGDVIWVKSYVAKKYRKDGENIARLVWWLETIDGVIYQEGAAEVSLPERQI